LSQQQQQQRRRRSDLRTLDHGIGLELGDSHSNIGEGKGSGSFTEPLYYSGHQEKLEALIDLFQQHGVFTLTSELVHSSSLQHNFVHASSLQGTRLLGSI